MHGTSWGQVLQRIVLQVLRQVLQRAMNLLQIATGITKCDDYYKLRQYKWSSD